MKELVIDCNVAEQVGHGLSIVDTADGFRQDHADINSFDLGALQLLNFMRNSICYHHLEGERRR